MKLGYEVITNDEELKVTRRTKETFVTVRLNTKKDRPLEIKTPIPFQDHMIDTIAWRASMNIGVTIEESSGLTHPIAEDVGITLGRAVLELYRSKSDQGTEGFGSARGMIDEAIAEVSMSLEGRANTFIEGPEFDMVDGMSSHDILAFLEGFSQGCKCTLRVEFKGRDPHHSWEAVFRAFGLCLRDVLQRNDWMKGSISGLKGILE